MSDTQPERIDVIENQIMSSLDEAIVFYFGSAEVARRAGQPAAAEACTQMAEHYVRVKEFVDAC